VRQNRGFVKRWEVQALGQGERPKAPCQDDVEKLTESQMKTFLHAAATLAGQMALRLACAFVLLYVSVVAVAAAGATPLSTRYCY